MRHAFRALPLALALPLLATEPRDPHDVRTYGVVWQVAGMDRITPKAGIRFGEGDLALDLYLPPGDARGPHPIVVFANGTGLPFPTWEIYRDWGRLVAAHGMAGVVYQSGTDGRKSLEAVLAHLNSHAADYGLDTGRVGVWACSANVSTALPWLMEAASPSVKAAVLYYGAAAVPRLRKDLPVFYVLAGRDGPALISAERALFETATREGIPWTMVNEPALTHAFDAVDEATESRRVVKETVAWLVDRLVAPPPAGPPPSAARSALTHVYGREVPEAAAEYRAIVKANPKDATALRALRVTLYNSACAEALAGRKEAALARLGEAVDEGFSPREVIERDADLVSLREDPRFLAILARVKPGP